MRYIISFLFLCQLAWAQIPIPVNYDTIYNDDIASLKCNVSGLPLTLPLIELGKDVNISISYDDLGGAQHRYRYEIIHVDKNWQRDELNELEYIEGFNRSEIRSYAYSTNRNANYTHYSFYIPNQEIKLKISGNYLLHVYEEPKRGQRNYIFTRRILVVDPKVKVSPLFVRPSDALLYRSNQELDLEVFVKGFNIYNSREEITASVMQNGRWATLIPNIKQNRDKTDYLVMDYIDKITFRAGKEFRFFDTRTLLFRSRFVKKITNNKDETIVTLYDDKLRDGINFIAETDANGNYILDNSDYPDAPRSSEYTWVDFTLQVPEFKDLKVFVIGAFCDWQCKPMYQLKWDAESGKYLGSAFLKQGYYNYAYAIQGPNGETTSSPIEGDWYETENEYQVMIYYRPFGTRYDQLICCQTFSTKQ